MSPEWTRLRAALAAASSLLVTYSIAVVARPFRCRRLRFPCSWACTSYVMSNDQIAAVVNYVRTHFDNSYRDEFTTDDVKAVRR
jgi:hypothetical protein